MCTSRFLGVFCLSYLPSLTLANHMRVRVPARARIHSLVHPACLGAASLFQDEFAVLVTKLIARATLRMAA